MAGVRRAFPEEGRVVRNGTVLVDGVPVSSADFTTGPEPSFAPLTSDIPSALAADGLCVQVLQAKSALDVASEDIPSEEPAAIVADASTDADLDAWARWLARAPEEWIVAGSAGLIPRLPPALGFAERPRTPFRRTGPGLVVVIGSRDPRAAEQADLLRERIAPAEVFFDRYGF